MDTKNYQKEDLKAFAGKACIDIFNDYSWEEVCQMSNSIKLAWDVGKALANLK